MREKIRHFKGEGCRDCQYNDECNYDPSAHETLCDRDTDQILELISAEIKKVENPYPITTRYDECFEECRQKILELLEGKNLEPLDEMKEIMESNREVSRK